MNRENERHPACSLYSGNRDFKKTLLPSDHILSWERNLWGLWEKPLLAKIKSQELMGLTLPEARSQFYGQH